MRFYVSLALGYVILVPVITALLHCRGMLKTYRYFIWFLCIGLANQVVNTITSFVLHNNMVNSNIYLLVEAYLIILLFYDWESFRKKMLFFLFSLIGIAWILQNFIISSLNHVNSGFRLFYYLIVIILSIDQINLILIHERKKLFRNAQFIICCVFAFYYAFRATYEIFYIIPGAVSADMSNYLFRLIVVADMVANLGYTYAAMRIPGKQRFTLPY
jgi:hypothetical protein